MDAVKLSHKTALYRFLYSHLEGLAAVDLIKHLILKQTLLNGLFGEDHIAVAVVYLQHLNLNLIALFYHFTRIHIACNSEIFLGHKSVGFVSDVDAYFVFINEDYRSLDLLSGFDSDQRFAHLLNKVRILCLELILFAHFCCNLLNYPVRRGCACRYPYDVDIIKIDFTELLRTLNHIGSFLNLSANIIQLGRIGAVMPSYHHYGIAPCSKLPCLLLTLGRCRAYSISDRYIITAFQKKFNDYLPIFLICCGLSYQAQLIFCVRYLFCLINVVNYYRIIAAITIYANYFWVICFPHNYNLFPCPVRLFRYPLYFCNKRACRIHYRYSLFRKLAFVLRRASVRPYDHRLGICLLRRIDRLDPRSFQFRYHLRVMYDRP